MIVFTIITVGKSTWHAQEGDAEGVILQTNKEKSALAPTKRRKRRSTEENMDRIIRAAADEFKAAGFTGATTAAIARNAEVTEAQLFRYFASKAELFRESVFKPLNQHFLDFFHSSGQSDAAEAETRDDLSRRYISELQQFLSEHSKMLMSLVVAQTYAPGTDGVNEFDSLNTYFERGAAMMTGRMARTPKVDPKLMVRVSFAAVLACILFKEWIFPPGMASDGEIGAAIKDFVMDGINANAN
jgi:AcrR family transcriptional regulator